MALPKAPSLTFLLFLLHITVDSGTFLLCAVWKWASECFSDGRGLLGPWGMVNRVFQRLLSPESFLD